MKVDANRYQCDGCGKVEVAETDEPPLGITIQWGEHHVGGGDNGTLWVCREQCVGRAFKRRREIENLWG